MSPSRNLAARAGAWSAGHRRIAILGWLAFVIVAFVAGNAAGMKNLSDTDTGNGESRVAEEAIDAAGFRDRAGEQVLVQSRGTLRASDAAFAAAPSASSSSVMRARTRRSRNPSTTTSSGRSSCRCPSR